MRSASSLIFDKSLWQWLCCGLMVIGLPLHPLRSTAQVVNTQIIPDRASGLDLGSIVNCNAGACIITGGTAAQGNLFHSFSAFSLGTQQSAIFDGGIGRIDRILVRVTGGQASQIDGLLQTTGNLRGADLFFLNPQGIQFGSGARLDLGGSFFATTADRLQFQSGFFGVTGEVPTAPLLTINQPIGAWFGRNPGPIDISGNGHLLSAQNSIVQLFTGDPAPQSLAVTTGRSLVLLGGNINLTGGVLSAPQGQIKLGSVANGFVKFSPVDFNLDYSKIQSFLPINLQNRSLIDVSAPIPQLGGIRSGSIAIQGSDLTLGDTSLILSQNYGFLPGGNIEVNLSGQLVVSGTDATGITRTGIFNNSLVGDGGSVIIQSHGIEVRDGAALGTLTFGTGQGGDLSIQTQTLNINGVSPQSPLSNSALAAFTLGAGHSGNMNLNLSTLNILAGGVILSGSFGSGNGGNIQINADRSILVSGFNPIAKISSTITPSAFRSGRAGDISIITPQLTLAQGGQISAATFASGDAGNVSIQAQNILLEGNGDNPTNQTTLAADAGILPLASQIRFGVTSPTGRSGDLQIQTQTLIVNNKASISANNLGTGSGGKLDILARQITLDTQGKITTETRSGEGGNISINATDRLVLRRGSQITTEAGGTGNGGNISLNTPFLVAIPQENSDIIANAQQGNGGNININAHSILGINFRSQLTSLSDISASSQFGVSGVVTLNQPQDNLNSGLVTLPTQPLDPSTQIKHQCLAASGNRFTVTGRGGIPEDPLADLHTEPFSGLSLLSEALKISNIPKEAQNWTRDQAGNIVLSGNTQSDLLSQLTTIAQWRTLGQYQRAITALESLLNTTSILTSVPDINKPLIQAILYRELGILYTLTGNLGLANKALNQSLILSDPFAKTVSEKLVSSFASPTASNGSLASLPMSDHPVANLIASATWLELGNLAENQHLYDFAFAFYQRSIALTQTVPSALAPQAQFLQLQAQVILLQLGVEQETTVKALLPKVLNTLSHPENRADRPRLYTALNLADSLRTLHPQVPFQWRLDLLQFILTQAQQNKDDRALVYAQQELAYLYLDQGSTTLAQSWSTQALSLAQQLQSPELIVATAPFLAERLAAVGQIQDALRLYGIAYSAVKALRSDLLTVSSELQFHLRDQVQPIYQRFIELLLTPDPLTPDGLNPLKALPQNNLRQVLAVMDSAQLSELDNFFGDTCLQAHPQDLSSLDTHTAVLYPILLNDRLTVIAELPGQPLKLYQIKAPQTSTQTVLQDFYSSLYPGYSPQEHLRLAQQLYQWLIAPLIPDLEAAQIKTLVFVPTGFLRNIPFAALHDGEHYLIERYGVVLSPSLQLLPPRPPQTKPAVMVAALTAARQGFPALPGVQQEATAIESLFPDTAKVLLNQTFTTQGFSQQVVQQQPTILHLATHAQFSSELSNTFLLTWDGHLGIQDFARLLQPTELGNTHPVDLLVMSACQTAKGDDRANLGLAGFALRSGARSTIATLWSVNDQSTAQLMTALYQALQSPTPIHKSEALRQAQLSLLNNPATHHPYFWAGFVLIGNWL